MSQGRNITQETREARQSAVKKAVERIRSETGECPWQIAIDRIIEGITGDRSFAACRKPSSRKKAVDKAMDAVYGARPKTIPQNARNSREIAGRNEEPPLKDLKDLFQHPPASPKSFVDAVMRKVDLIVGGLRGLKISDEKSAEILTIIARSQEKENAELRCLLAKAREENTAAWIAVAHEREQKEMLEKKIKGNANHQPIDSAKHMVAFGK